MAILRHIPHQGTIQQFKKQAKELLRDYRQGAVQAVHLFRELHPHFDQRQAPKLADAQLVVARQYGQPSWTKLKKAVQSLPHFRRLLECFSERNYQAAKKLIEIHPILLERGDILGRAVRHGDLKMVRLMYELGARNVQQALGNIVYGDKRDIARYLISLGGSFSESDQYGPILLGACEVLNKAAFETVLELSDQALDKDLGYQCLAMLLSTYSRRPADKHACIERLIRESAVEVPDTPVMALHRGRIDLLSQHLKNDSGLFARSYTEAEIYPPEFGIAPGDGLHLTPLSESTLLHMAVEFDERDILQWMLENGADPNATAGIDGEGFGGHTPLFHTTVSYAWQDASKAKALLKAGARPDHRATLRKQLRYMGRPHLERMYEFHDVTCIGFARKFQVQRWVSQASIAVVEASGR